MSDIPYFEPIDDCPHRASDDPTFQESSLFVWHDLKQGIGGFWRLGQEPVLATLNSCFAVFTREGQRFRSNVTGAPMAPGDRGATHMGWGGELRVDLDRLAIRADFADCEAALRFEDFYPRYDYVALVKGPPMGDSGAHHFEVGGRLTGRLRIGERELEIDALGYRDRSWGPRAWSRLRSTRWWPSVYGSDLAAHLLAVVTDSGHYMTCGYVIRDGVAQAITASDITATLDADALSPRAGHARFTLDNGEQHEISHARSDGVVLHVRGYTAVESIGVARWGERTGMSNLEVCTNPTGGQEPPSLALGANNGQGLSRRDAGGGL